MKVIGLTGGIASGKSTVSKALQDLGAIVIDFDQIAHEVMEPHQSAWNEVVKSFGKGILNPDLTINREELGNIVFNDQAELKKLNKLVHPRVMERFQAILDNIRNSQPEAIIVLDVPLLFETRMERFCDAVWVVGIDRETQIERLMLRNNLSRDEAIARIDSQMPFEDAARRADAVIDNGHSVEETIAIATRYFNDIKQNP